MKAAGLNEVEFLTPINQMEERGWDFPGFCRIAIVFSPAFVATKNFAGNYGLDTEQRVKPTFCLRTFGLQDQGFAIGLRWAQIQKQTVWLNNGPGVT